MKFFLHTTTDLTIEDLDPSTTLQEIADGHGIADATAWLEDVDDPLDISALLSEALRPQQHLHLSSCRRVVTTVAYAGRTISDEFPPGTTIGRVRTWAVGHDGFDLPQKERPRHEVGLCGSGVIADRNDHIGTLATDCALCLDLAPKDRFQG